MRSSARPHRFAVARRAQQAKLLVPSTRGNFAEDIARSALADRSVAEKPFPFFLSRKTQKNGHLLPPSLLAGHPPDHLGHLPGRLAGRRRKLLSFKLQRNLVIIL